MTRDLSPELGRALAEVLGLPISHVRPLGGGMSADSDLLLAGDRPIVLRRHGAWSVGFDDGVADREFAMFQLAHEVGLAPKPLWAGYLLGRTALVTEAVDGHPLLAPGDPFDWARQLASVLVRIHAIDPTPGVLAHIAAAPVAPQEQPPDARVLEHPEAARLLTRLGELRRSDDVLFVHGDYWPGNTMWKRETLVGVIDWEAVDVADPASDVAYCACEMHYLGYAEAADFFIETYRALSGRSLPSLPYWTVRALLRPLPDIGILLPSWEGLGRTEDPDAVRERHRQLVSATLG